MGFSKLSGRGDALFPSMKAAVFIERDGVLNHHVPGPVQPGIPCRVEQFRLIDGVRPLLQSLREAGLLILVTTVQPGISRGDMSRGEVDMMHRILMHKLPVDEVLLCASDDPTHPCYKPQPGLFLEAAFKYGLDLDRCFVVSDKWQDAKAAQVVGSTSMMIRSPWVGDDHHDFVVEDFEAAVRKILGRVAAGGVCAAVG